VPVGVPAPGAITLRFAVRVIDVFKIGELAEEVSAVDVDAWFTTWDSADDVLARKLESPL
jgi:hypothetical protein